MEIDKNLSIRGQAEHFLRSLPKEGVIFHITPSKNREMIEREGLRGPRNIVWFFAFQTSSRNCIPNFSSREITAAIRKFRGTIRSGLLETSQHNLLRGYYLEEEYPSVVAARRLIKNKEESETVSVGSGREFAREVAKNIPPERILFIASLSRIEYEELVNKVQNSKLPVSIRSYTDPKSSYLEHELAKLLSRKIIAGLLNYDESNKNFYHQENGFVSFISKILHSR